MNRNQKWLRYGLAAVTGAAIGAAAYFIQKHAKAKLESDFQDFTDEFEESEPDYSTRSYTPLPKEPRSKESGKEEEAPVSEENKSATVNINEQKEEPSSEDSQAADTELAKEMETSPSIDPSEIDNTLL